MSLEFVVFTLFPEMFTGMLTESMLGRALEAGAVTVEIVNFRDYATDKHRTVDDYPFGGGAGMLLKPEPLFAAVEDVALRPAAHHAEETSQSNSVTPHVVLLSPQGRPFTQSVALEFARRQRVFLICGHYEGFDERVRTHLVDEELSLGDFVLTGGEIAALAVIDAVTRLLPGVLGNEVSAADDSFSSGGLEYPQYTRPAEFRGWRVPDVLLSGHHGRIATWRRLQALHNTWLRRPDLVDGLTLSNKEAEIIARWKRGDFSDLD